MADEFEYTIDEDAIGKFLSESSTKNSDNLGVHLAVLRELREIIDTSIDCEVHPDYIEKDENGRRIAGRYNPDVLMHRFYGAINIDGETYRVKTMIKEDRSNDTNRAYTYEVTNIELLGDHKGQTQKPTPRTTSSSISGAKLLQGVEKSYENGEKLLNSTKIVDKNGEPLVMSHNTDKEFTIFDRERIGTGTGLRTWMRWSPN